MLSNTGLVGQCLGQPRAPIQGFGRSSVQSTSISNFEVKSSFGAYGAQRPQIKAQTRIFSMAADEA